MPFNNPKTEFDTEDFLNVDTPVPGQNYCCMSFISPNNIIAKREPFIVKKFLQSLLSDKSISDLAQDTDSINAKFDDFMALNEEKLESEFHESVDFTTSVRGVKVRGVYDTLKEAEARASLLQRQDRSHNIFLGQVGYWLPIDADPNSVPKSEYLESELNELMKSYKENEVKRDQFYSEQVGNYKASTSKTTHEHLGAVQELPEKMEESLFNAANVETQSGKN